MSNPNIAANSRTHRGGRPAPFARYDRAPTEEPEPPANIGEDRLSSVNDRVNEVKSSLQKNIELAITRGDKLEDIDVRTEQLAEDANTFQTSAKKVRSMFLRRYWKMIGLLTLLVVIIIIIIVVVSQN